MLINTKATFRLRSTLQFIVDTQSDRHNYYVLLAFTLILGLGNLVSAGVGAVAYVSNANNFSDIWIIACNTSGIVGTCATLALISNAYSQRNLKIARRITIISTSFVVIATSWLLGSSVDTQVILLIPVALTIGLEESYVILVTILCTLSCLLLYLCQNVYNLYTPLIKIDKSLVDGYNFVAIIIGLPSAIAYLTIPLKLQQLILKSKNSKLEILTNRLRQQLDYEQALYEQIVGNLADELHGEPLQLLFKLLVYQDQTLDELDTDLAVFRDIVEQRTLTTKLETSLRSLIKKKLLPTDLYENIIGNLEDLISKYRQQVYPKSHVHANKDISFHFDYPKNQDDVVTIEKLLSKKAKVGLYLTARDALNNILQHSQAQNVHITLAINYPYQDIPVIEFVIKDDGIGIEPVRLEQIKSLDSGEHFGMLRMSLRIENLCRVEGSRASIHFYSALRAGLTIKIKIQPNALIILE